MIFSSKKVRRVIRPLLFLMLVAVFHPSIVAAEQTDMQGHWEGTIDVAGTKLDVDVDLTQVEDDSWTGDISIPVQGLKDLALVDLVVEGKDASFRIDGIPGEPTFSGSLSEDGAAFSGDFTQGGQTFPFLLRRGDKPAEKARVALEGIDDLINRALKDFNVPGLGISVVVDGELIHSQGYGYRDVEEKLPVTEDTLFAIGSCSKAFTAYLVGTLVDKGLIEWDTPVIDYIPDFRLYDDHATKNLTVRDLLTHRSGLPRHDAVWYNSSLNREELIRRLQYLEPFADLREKYHYQNLMYMTAGYLAERITGETWEQLVQKRILGPLGMAQSNLSVEDSQQVEDFAWPYAEEEEAVKRIPFRNIDAVGPAGSINAGVREMSQWLKLLVGLGQFEGQQILRSTTAKEMFTPQTIMAGYPSEPAVLLTTYGLGWTLSSYRGHYLALHGGGIDGFTASVAVMPLDGIGIVALSNRAGTPLPGLVSRHIADRILALEERDWLGETLKKMKAGEEVADEAEEKKDLARQEGTSPSHPLADYAGDYDHPGYGTIKVELVDETLKTTYNNMSSPMEHWHYDVFNTVKGAESSPIEGTKLLFRSNLKGQIAEIAVSMDPSVEDAVFKKSPDARLYDPEFLGTLVGEYMLADVTVKVELVGDKLNATVPGQPTYELEPAAGTEFLLKGLSGFSAVFILDENGKATELQFHQPNGVFSAKPSEAEKE